MSDARGFLLTNGTEILGMVQNWRTAIVEGRLSKVNLRWIDQSFSRPRQNARMKYWLETGQINLNLPKLIVDREDLKEIN